MSFWKRIKRVVKAQANATLDKFEDPDKELDLLEEELEEEKKRGRQRIADAMVEVKRLEKSVEKAREDVDKWEQKAIKAVELGDDDLAREALARKASCDEILAEQEEGLRTQQTALKELKGHQKILEEQVDAAQRKRKVLQARIKGAKIKEGVGHAVSTIDPDAPLAEFERMTKAVEALEAKVEMNKELDGELAANEFDRKLRELEDDTGSSAGAEEDPLAALKAKMKRKEE